MTILYYYFIFNTLYFIAMILPRDRNFILCVENGTLLLNYTQYNINGSQPF